MSSERAGTLLDPAKAAGKGAEEGVVLDWPYSECAGCGTTLVEIRLSGQAGFHYKVFNIDSDGGIDIVDHAEMPHPRECLNGKR